MSRGTRNLWARARAASASLCFCHFTTSRFGKLTSEPLGRKKIRHHLPPVTNNIFWIMIASIGLCICKMWGNEFLLVSNESKQRCYVSALERAPLDAWLTAAAWQTVSVTTKHAPLIIVVMMIIIKKHVHSPLHTCRLDVPVCFNGVRIRRRRGECVTRGWKRGRKGLQRPERLWLSGLLKSFWGIGLESIVCHTRVTLPLSDEPSSYAINSVIAQKCIYLICETMTVLLDLWRKARFN